MDLSAEEAEKIEIKMDKECLYVKIKSNNKIRKFYFAGANPHFMAKEIRKEIA